MDDILTTRRIGHSEAQEIAQRLINSRFGHGSHDLLIFTYIKQQEAKQNERVEANTREVRGMSDKLEAALKAYRDALGQYDPDLRPGSEEQTLRALLAAIAACFGLKVEEQK